MHCKTRPFYTCVFLLLFAIACKKNDSANNNISPSAKKNYYITSIYDSTDGSVGTVNLLYDSHNRLSSSYAFFFNPWNPSATSSQRFADTAYSSTFVKMFVVLNGYSIDPVIDSMVLDGNGCIAAQYSLSSSGPSLQSTFSYDAAKHISQQIAYNPNSSHNTYYNYTWQNGDMISDGSTTYIYDVTKSNTIGNYSQTNALRTGLDSCLKGFFSTHLLTASITGTDTTRFTYSFDTNNNIKTIILSDNSGNRYLSYQYIYK